MPTASWFLERHASFPFGHRSMIVGISWLSSAEVSVRWFMHPKTSKSPKMLPISCAEKERKKYWRFYEKFALPSLMKMARVTAGLKCPPPTEPRKQISEK